MIILNKDESMPVYGKVKYTNCNIVIKKGFESWRSAVIWFNRIQRGNEGYEVLEISKLENCVK